MFRIGVVLSDQPLGETGLEASSRIRARKENRADSTKWGCSANHIVLETPYAGILAFSRMQTPHLTAGMSPKKKSNQKSAQASDILIPEKLYFRIGEVARLCRLPAYVLRFWETEFPQLKPVKSSTGQRMYRRRDVESVLRIKKLLYEDGFTIAGARGQLKEEIKSERNQSALPFPMRPAVNVAHLQHELRAILHILSARH